MVPAEGGEHFSKNVSENYTKRVLRAGGPDEKEQLACAMHKLKAVVHEVVSPAGLLEAKNAPMEREENELNEQRSDWIE